MGILGQCLWGLCLAEHSQGAASCPSRVARDTSVLWLCRKKRWHHLERNPPSLGEHSIIAQDKYQEFLGWEEPSRKDWCAWSKRGSLNLVPLGTTSCSSSHPAVSSWI